MSIAIESQAINMGRPFWSMAMSPTGKVRVIACIILCKMNINNKQPW